MVYKGYKIMIDDNEIAKTLKKIYDTDTSLDMLLEFEEVLDTLHIYAYKNWIIGEVAGGPEISRYWVEVTLMYPYKQMPDPDGALRLIKHGCYVYYGKYKYRVSKEIETPDDLELTVTGSSTSKRKPKKEIIQVWLVKISMPRHFVDEFDSEKVKINGAEIDMSAVTDAFDKGLDSKKNSGEENEDN
jgi:hypothetical protein